MWPAATPPPATPAFEVAALSAGPAWVPRVAEDGPVEVYDLSGHLLLRVPCFGLVRDLALSRPHARRPARAAGRN
jgi:hypothetical protein